VDRAANRIADEANRIARDQIGFNLWQLILNAAVMGFTGWAAWAAGIAARVAKRAEADAEKSIELAATSAEALLETSKVLSRAHAANLDVSTCEATQHSPNEVFAGIGFEAVWKNVGPTQALGVDAFICSALVNPAELELGLDIVFEEWGNARNLGSGNILKTERIMLAAPYCLKVWAGEATYLIYTRVRYHDLFEAIERQEERCFQFRIFRDPRLPVNVETPPWDLITYVNFTSRKGERGTGGFKPRDAPEGQGEQNS